MSKIVSILGSTGSIGTQALDVIKKAGFTVSALTANSSVDVLEKQIREFKPKLAAVRDEKSADDLKARVKDTFTRVLSGEEGVCECAACEESELQH